MLPLLLSIQILSVQKISTAKTIYEVHPPNCYFFDIANVGFVIASE